MTIQPATTRKTARTERPAAHVPQRWVGPIRISGNVATTETEVPLATYETPCGPRSAAAHSSPG